jgi:hypothetical protein
MQDMSPETLKSIYLRGILPSATYALSIWGNCCDTQLSRLNDCHCKVARMILRAKTDESNCEILKRIGWDSFNTMYKKQIACLAFKLLKNELPKCLEKWKPETKIGRALRNDHRVRLPSFKKMSYKKSFAYRSAVIWNQLSNDTVNQTSTHMFKCKLNAEVHSISFVNGAMRKRNNEYIYY